MELALDEVNAKGVLGGRKIDLTVEDSAGNKDQAINAARKLIGRDKVVAIIGPTLSNEMFAVGPVANERKIPILGTSTTANGITAIGPYVFRTSLPESDVIPVTLKKAISRGVKTIALMYANDDAFSKSGYDVMKAAAEKAGLKIVDDRELRQQGHRFLRPTDQDQGAEARCDRHLGPGGAGLGRAAGGAAAGLRARRRCSSAATAATRRSSGRSPGKAADGLLVGSPWFIGKPTPVNEKFVAAFQKKYGKEPDQFAAQAYDALKIMAAAIEPAGAADPAKVRER